MAQPVLLDLGAAAYAHQADVDEVKRQLGIPHAFFDCWIFGFLENKGYNVAETVAKLQRREEFERNELAMHNITDWMMESMRKGTIQVIGDDKEGRVTFYITTARDHPTSAKREESRKNFDMWLSYGTRLRKENKRCQITMLINQDKASMWSNVDMTFQADVALRIAKYYPGCVAKMYICNMGRALAAMAKPIFSRLPTIVSERIQIFSDSDIKSGVLLSLFDEHVLPVALGGLNDCDNQENWNNFAVTIKEHFLKLKEAVTERGLSVKEWELEGLHAEGAVPPLRPAVDELRMAVLSSAGPERTEPGREVADPAEGGWIGFGVASRGAPQSAYPSCVFSPRSSDDVTEEDEWYTCDAETVDVTAVKFITGRGGHSSSIPVNALSFASMTSNDRRDSYFVDHFNTLERFFRASIVEMHEREWLTILQRELQDRTVLSDRANDIDGDALARAFPVPLRFAVRGCIWLLLIIMSFYFLVGTLFCAILGCCIAIQLFFAMFAQPYYIFPYGAALIVTGYQFAVLCSRGLNLTQNTFNGKIVEGFRILGTKLLILQGLLYLGGVVALFVIFCVFAAQADPLTGMQYSVAVGWICAACVTLLYHFAYGFGLGHVAKAKQRDHSRCDHAETTVYLFLNVDMDEEEMEPSWTTELLLLSAPMILGFVFGLCYMLSHILFFLCATIACTLLVQLMATVFITASTPSSKSSLMVASVTYGGVFWLYTTFAMALLGWDDHWGESVITALFLVLLTSATSFSSSVPAVGSVARRWLFRVGWFVLVANLVGGVITLLVINYRVGLFVTALAAHLILYNFRAHDCVTTSGVALMSGGFLVILLVCVILGSYAWADGTYTSASVTMQSAAATLVDMASRSARTGMMLEAVGASPGPARAATATASTSASIVPALCSAWFSPGLTILDMVRFAKVAHADSSDARDADLAAWLPSFSHADVLPSVPGSFVEGHVFVNTPEGTDASANVTAVVAFRENGNLMASMEALTMWIHGLAMSFMELLMPREWLPRALPYIAFMSSMAPVNWRTTMTAIRSQLQEVMSSPLPSGATPSIVYVVGSGPSGALAAVSAAPLGIPSIVFAGPDIMTNSYIFGLDQATVFRHILSVVPSKNLFLTSASTNPGIQVVPCAARAGTCDTVDHLHALLARLCPPSTLPTGRA